MGKMIVLSSMWNANDDLDGEILALFSNSNADKAVERAIGAFKEELENGIDEKYELVPSEEEINDFVSGSALFLEWSISYDEAEQGKYLVRLTKQVEEK